MDIFYVFNNILFTKEDKSEETAEIRQGCTALARKATKPLLWSRTGISPGSENVKQTRRLKTWKRDKSQTMNSSRFKSQNCYGAIHKLFTDQDTNLAMNFKILKNVLNCAIG